MQNNFFLAPSADARISKAIFCGRKDFSEIFCRNSVWRARESPILRSSPAPRAAGARRLDYHTPRSFFETQASFGQPRLPGRIETEIGSPARYVKKQAIFDIRIAYDGSGYSEETWPDGRVMPAKVWPDGKDASLEAWPDVRVLTEKRA